MADLTAKIGVDTSELGKGLDDATQKISRFGQNLTSLGKGLTVGLTLPIMAVGTAAFKMAADLESALGATEQIFDSASESVKSWAESLPNYYGIATKEALGYSNMMGTMLKNISGLTEKEAGEQSAKLIELAGDLAAVYGGSTADAVRALMGALKGNNRMLGNYGIAANDALVKGKAFEMGLIAQGEEMSLLVKQAATLALIYDQTSAAQGQAAKGTMTASGAMRAFQTSIKNLVTEFGQHLLPVLTPIINKITEFVEYFRELNPTIQKGIVIVSALAAALGPVLVVVGGLISTFPATLAGLSAIIGTAGLAGLKAALLSLLGPVTLVTAALVGIVVAVVKNWDKIKPYIMNTIKYFVDLYNESVVLRIAVAHIATNFKNTFDVVKRVLQGAWEVIKTWAKASADAIAGVGDVFKGVLTLDASAVASGIKKVRDAQVYAFTSMGNDIEQTIKGIYSDVKENISEGLDMVRNVDPLTMEDLFPTKPLKIEIPSLVDTKKLEGDAEDLGEQIGDKIKEGIEKSLAVEKTTLVQMGRQFTVFPDIIVNPNVIVTDDQRWQLKLMELNQQLSESMTDLFEGSISGTVTSLFDSIGTAIGEGGNVVQAMGQALLQSFGSFLSELGGMLIKYGMMAVVFGRLQEIIMRGTPGQKITAGLAAIAVGALLVAAGGALSAAAGGGMSGGGGGGGGYTGYSAYDSPAPNNAAINNAQDQQQNVTFRISGRDLVGVVETVNERNQRI